MFSWQNMQKPKLKYEVYMQWVTLETSILPAIRKPVMLLTI